MSRSWRICVNICRYLRGITSPLEKHLKTFISQPLQGLMSHMGHTFWISSSTGITGARAKPISAKQVAG